METKRYSVWADLGVLAAIFFGATLVVSIVGGVVMTASGGSGQAAAEGSVMSPWAMFTVYVSQFALAVAGGMLWLRSRGGVKLGFGVHRSDGPLIVAGIVLATAAGIVIEPLLALFPDSYLEQLNDMIGRGGWSILMTVVAAPVLEEIFFRGLVLERLSRRWSGAAAVLVSSAFFGLVHTPILPQMVNAFVIAVVMGYIYLQTRSLVPVIAIHAINNGLAYLTLELTGTQATDTRAMLGNDPIYWTVYAASALLLVAAIVVLHRRACTKNKKNTFQEKTADE